MNTCPRRSWDIQPNLQCLSTYPSDTVVDSPPKWHLHPEGNIQRAQLCTRVSPPHPRTYPRGTEDSRLDHPRGCTYRRRTMCTPIRSSPLQRRNTIPLGKVYSSPREYRSPALCQSNSLAHTTYTRHFLRLSIQSPAGSPRNRSWRRFPSSQEPCLLGTAHKFRGPQLNCSYQRHREHIRCYRDHS